MDPSEATPGSERSTEGPLEETGVSTTPSSCTEGTRSSGLVPSLVWSPVSVGGPGHRAVNLYLQTTSRSPRETRRHSLCRWTTRWTSLDLGTRFPSPDPGHLGAHTDSRRLPVRIRHSRDVRRHPRRRDWGQVGVVDLIPERKSPSRRSRYFTRITVVVEESPQSS